MNRPRWQKVLSDLWGNRSRSLLVVASITVGLFAIGVIANIYAVIAQDMRASYAAVNPANVYFRTSLYDEDLLDSLADLEGVRQAEGVRQVDLRVMDRQGEWTALDVKSVPDLAGMAVNQVRLVAGTWPPGEGEVALDQHKWGSLGVPLGGMVRVERPSGKGRELKLVGVVQDVTIGAFSGGGGFFNAPAQAYVDRETLELLEQPSPELLSGVYLTASDPNSGAVLQAVAARAADHLEENGVEVSSSNTRRAGEHPNSDLVNAIVGVLFVLGLLVVFLSGFLITNTLQALLNQQLQQIGIMKTVGARWLQIAGVYVALILAFGLLAFALAMPLAYRLSFSLLDLLAGQLNFVLQGERVLWPVVLLQGGLALVMPQLAAWLPIWNGARVSVQDALSGVVGRRAARQPARPRARIRLFRLPRPLLISLRNTFRRKGRLALTLITLSLGGAVFIATFNVQVSLGKYIDQIGQYFLSDVNVSLDRPYRAREIESLLADVPGVGRVEGWAAARAELVLEDGSAGDRVNLLAPPAGSRLVEPVMMSGRWIGPLDENAIVLNEMFAARFLGLAVGDRLALQVNGDETEWVVVGFFRFAGKNGGYSAYTSYDYLTRLTGQLDKAGTYRVVADRPALSAAEQDRLAKAIETRLDAEGIRVVDRSTGAYMTDVAGGGFAVLTAFLLFLAVLTALVGSIGLAGTMSMNVLDRTREIGVLRAIGASDGILVKMVLVEGILIGLISYLLGALASFPISKLMADGISLAIFEAPASPGFTALGFLVWLAVVVVLSLAASLVPARSAARLTIREVLSYE
jgi:putative ABC transport system permease protein